MKSYFELPWVVSTGIYHLKYHNLIHLTSSFLRLFEVIFVFFLWLYGRQLVFFFKIIVLN